jgi:dolichol kinase
MQEFFNGLLILIIYFISCATIAFVCRKMIKIPNELFRKILHFILLTSLFVFIFAFKTWWSSVLACILIIVVAYPILFFFERFKTYSDTVTERKKGELKSSLILVFLMFAVIITVCWKILDNKLLALPVIYAWGYGDALAALIGTKFGKRKIYKKKSLEGTLAMFITSIIVVSVLLSIINIIRWYGVIITTILTSIAVTIVELYTPNGLDTITCPFTSLIIMIPLLVLFGGLI